MVRAMEEAARAGPLAADAGLHGMLESFIRSSHPRRAAFCGHDFP